MPEGVVRAAEGIVRAVLFDLDGTLADTAPDLCLALNRLRAEHGLAPVPDEATRAHTSSGARGLLKVGFDRAPGDVDYELLKARFLELYESDLVVHTRLFEGISALLDELEQRTLAWGIVTNKAKRFTEPLMRQMGLAARAACIVSGDSTPHTKPHPAPMLHAAAQMGLPPANCLYLGDDLRDVQAAHAAGMRAIAVRYGYLGEGGPIETWQADAIIDHPRELLDFL
jgi:2-phosphoglycolate phosphatase